MTSFPEDRLMHDGTILLIDDDDAVRRVLARVLRGAGYLVHDFESGESAVEFVRCHAGPIDLLVTDTVLPGMSGVAAAEAIRLLRPALPVLQMSGYTDQDIGRHASEQAYHFIGKPFRSDRFTRCVRAIVGAPAQPDTGVIAI